MKRRVVFFIHTEWALGSIHYELAKAIYSDIDVTLLSWDTGYTYQEIVELDAVTDLFVTLPSAAKILIKDYKINPSKISLIGHGISDFHQFLNELPAEYMDNINQLGVVSEKLKSQVIELGFTKIPQVLNVGVNTNRYFCKSATELKTVGYGSKFVRLDGHTTSDWKRGYLAAYCANQAGLEFKTAEGYHNSFVTMAGFYSQIDCLIVSSTEEEAAGLPALEAGAAGRLVITTPVGHASDYALTTKGGIGVPIDKDQFIESTINILNYYKQHPREFADKCAAIQEHARCYDWDVCKDSWIEFLSK